MYEKTLKSSVEKRLAWIKDKQEGGADLTKVRDAIAKIDGLLAGGFLGKMGTKSLQTQKKGLEKKLTHQDFSEELKILQPLADFISTSPDFNKAPRVYTPRKKATSKRIKK